MTGKIGVLFSDKEAWLTYHRPLNSSNWDFRILHVYRCTEKFGKAATQYWKGGNHYVAVTLFHIWSHLFGTLQAISTIRFFTLPVLEFHRCSLPEDNIYRAVTLPASYFVTFGVHIGHCCAAVAHIKESRLWIVKCLLDLTFQKQLIYFLVGQWNRDILVYFQQRWGFLCCADPFCKFYCIRDSF